MDEVILIYSNGTIYRGKTVNGVPSGIGEKVYYNGRIERGIFADGFLIDGEQIMEDGGYFKGMMKNGKAFGKGIRITNDNNKFIGEFSDNQYNGEGEIVFSDGAKYCGNFKRGRFDGRGTKIYPNGDVFTGQWKNGKPVGQ